MRADSKSFLMLVVTGVILVIFANPLEAAVQRMRLARGRYRVSGSAQRIPASCVDREREVPSPSDEFRFTAASIRVRKTVGDTIEEKPLQEYLGTDLRLTGTDGWDSIGVQPLRDNDPAVYEIIVEDANAIVGSSRNEVHERVQHFSRASDGLERLERYREQLLQTLGRDSKALARFDTAYRQEAEWRIGESNGERSETISRDIISDFRRREFLPLSIVGHPHAGDLLTLRLGREFTQAEWRNLENACGTKITFPTGKYENATLIRRTIDGLEVVSTKGHVNFDAKAANELLRGSDCVIVDADPSPELVGRLKASNVRFIRTWRDVTRDQGIRPARIRVFHVSADSDEGLRRLHEEQDPASIRRIENIANDIPDSSWKRVTSRAQLTRELARLTPEERAVVIFHHGERGIMFEDGPMSLREFAALGHHGIACDTFRRYPFPFGWHTVGQLDQEFLIRAVADEMRQVGERPVQAEQFFAQVSSRYNQYSSAHEKRKWILFGSLGFGGKGMIVAAMFAGSAGQGPDDEDDDERSNLDSVQVEGDIE